MHSTPAEFAVIRTDDSEIDVGVVAKLMAELLGILPVDLLPRLSNSNGILAEGLSELEAKRCEYTLLDEGITVRVIKCDALIEPPPTLVLRSASFCENELTYATKPEKGVFVEGSVRWTDFFWLDCVSIQRFETEEVEDWKVISNGEYGPRIKRIKTPRTKMDRPLQIDLISYDPWLWLQIPDEGFQFAATNLSIKSNRRENMRHVAMALALKAASARLGPGMKWFHDQSFLIETRMPSAEAYRKYLRWQLTRIWLESPAVNPQGNSNVNR